MLRRKSRVSYIVRDDYDSTLHKKGINSICIDYDSYHSYNGGKLYTAGRDAIINQWELNLERKNSSTETNIKVVQEQQIVPSPTSTDPKPETVSLAFDQRDDHHHPIPKLKSIITPIEKPTVLATSLEWHNDWVNSIVLCNNSQNLISCSSDRSVCIWNLETKQPTRLGFHNDYAKKLAHPIKTNWVCSASLDRAIHIWDIQETRNEPRVLNNTEFPTGSIYALACNTDGRVVASGSHDKFVRIWDPKTRSDRNQTHRLQGHTDTVRDLLISSDGKWVISASSDKTIKLWSLAMANHCVQTWCPSEASVWSLATNSQDINTFWAGAKDGWVYKIIQKNVDNDVYSDCFAICKEQGPVISLAGIEDRYIWTGTTDSTVNRWRDVGFGNDTDIYIPDSCYCHPDVVDIDTESIHSKRISISSNDEIAPTLIPLWDKPESVIKGNQF